MSRQCARKEGTHLLREAVVKLFEHQALPLVVQYLARRDEHRAGKGGPRSPIIPLVNNDLSDFELILAPDS